MKKNLYLCLALMISLEGLAQTCTPTATATENMTWTGAVSTNWNDACNWSPNGVPTATNTVSIPDVVNDPVIMSGTTAYAFRIDIGNNASLTINSGGKLTVDHTKASIANTNTINIFSNGTFTNNGTLNAFADRSFNMITVFESATFNNSGTANLSPSVNSITLVGPNAMVNNSASGIINFQNVRGINCISGTTGNVITNEGTMNYTGLQYFATLNPGFTLNNSGTIDIKSGAGIAVQGGTLNNLACAKILMSARGYENQFSSVTTNEGLMIIGNINTNGGSFTNNGVLNYGRLQNGSITNLWLIVNNDDSRIFTYGTAFNGTVNGIFTDAAATTSPGTFTAPNKFVLPCTFTGSRAFYAKITSSGGACTYIVPFNYAQPAFAGRAILLQPSCNGGTGNIGLYVSNLPICTPTVSLSFTATGAGATTSPQIVGVFPSASGGQYGLDVNFKAGTYSNFTITHNGYTVRDSRTYTLTEPAPLTITTTPSQPIYEGATSFTIPYTATTGSPTTYAISGTGIISVPSESNRTLPASPITVNLSAPASCTSIEYTLTVGSSFCTSAPVKGSVAVRDTEKPKVVAGILKNCYQSVEAAKTAAIAATTVTDNCTIGLIKKAEITETCPFMITVTATDGSGNSNFVTYTGIDIAAKGGTTVWKDNMTRTSRNLCPKQTVTIKLTGSFGRCVTWQKTNATSPIWTDIPNTAALTELTVGYESQTTYYRALICASCGLCAPPNYTAYSTSFKVSPAANCTGTTNDESTTQYNTSDFILSKVYPSPAKNNITVQIDDATEGVVQFEFYDISGKMVKKENRNMVNGYNEVSLNIVELASGLYLLQVKDRENHKKTIKVMKQ